MPTPNSKSLIANMHVNMLLVCEDMQLNHWEQIKPRIANEFDSLVLMLKWLKDMKDKQEMNAEQARIHIDIQKNTMRTRMMSMPGIDMLTAENMLNAAIDAVRKEIYDYLGWVVV